MPRQYTRAQRDRRNELKRLQRASGILPTCLTDRRYNLARYGLSVDDFEAMKTKQDGKCAICATVPDRLCVDHCHSTGAVRGLLCNHCNNGIGFFRDNPTLLRSGARYIQEN